MTPPDAAATDEEDDEHPRVAPGYVGAVRREELAQPAPEEPFVRGVRCFFDERGDGVKQPSTPRCGASRRGMA